MARSLKSSNPRIRWGFSLGNMIGYVGQQTIPNETSGVTDGQYAVVRVSEDGGKTWSTEFTGFDVVVSTPILKTASGRYLLSFSMVSLDSQGASVAAVYATNSLKTDAPLPVSFFSVPKSPTNDELDTTYLVAADYKLGTACVLVLPVTDHNYRLRCSFDDGKTWGTVWTVPIATRQGRAWSIHGVSDSEWVVGYGDMDPDGVWRTHTVRLTGVAPLTTPSVSKP